MSNKKVIIFCLVAFAAGWFAKGYLGSTMAGELPDDKDPGEDPAED